MAPLRRFATLLLFGGERRSGPGAQPKAWRRLFHLGAGSSIPIIAIFLAEDLLVGGLAVLGAGALAVDLARFRLEWLNRRYLRWFAPLLKGDESGHITGATYMVISALIVFLLYGKEVGVPVMFFLSLGGPGGSRSRPPGAGASPDGKVACGLCGLCGRRRRRLGHADVGRRHRAPLGVMGGSVHSRAGGVGLTAAGR